jgi:hypothetical protein
MALVSGQRSLRYDCARPTQMPPPATRKRAQGNVAPPVPARENRRRTVPDYRWLVAASEFQHGIAVGEQIARQLVEHPFIRQVMNLCRGPLSAPLEIPLARCKIQLRRVPGE